MMVLLPLKRAAAVALLFGAPLCAGFAPQAGRPLAGSRGARWAGAGAAATTTTTVRPSTFRHDIPEDDVSGGDVVSPFTDGVNSKGFGDSGDDDEILPLTIENVEKVLDEMRPYLMSDGGNVRLDEIDGPIVRLELEVGRARPHADDDATTPNSTRQANERTSKRARTKRRRRRRLAPFGCSWRRSWRRTVWFARITHMKARRRPPPQKQRVGPTAATSLLSSPPSPPRPPLQGACGTCPSSSMTMKMGLERRLKEAIPEILEVVQTLPSAPPLDLEGIELVLDGVRPFLNVAGGTIDVVSLSGQSSLQPAIVLKMSGQSASLQSVRVEIMQRIQRHFMVNLRVDWEEDAVQA